MKKVKTFIKKYGLLIIGIIAGIFVSSTFRKRHKIKTSKELRKKYKENNKVIDKFRTERKKQYAKLGRISPDTLDKYNRDKLSEFRKNQKMRDD
jgi:hypothetical protein